VSRRDRKKWKNSTPRANGASSFRGLASISATDGCDLGRAEIEFPVEILNGFEDLAVAEMRIVQRRNLRAFLRQEIDLLVVQPAVFLCLPVEEGARIGAASDT